MSDTALQLTDEVSAPATPAARFPRVLFCTSEVPQSVNAGSMQLYRVMQEYPADCVMVLGATPHQDAQLLDCTYEPLRLMTYRMACTRFRAWTTGFNAVNTWREPQIGRSVRLARKFDPDLVITVMDKLSYYKHAWALSRRLGVPLVTITMDDPETFERATRWLQPAVTRFLRRLYSQAALSLGVSAEMCDDILKRFGKTSTLFQFGPPDRIRPRNAEESRSLKSADRLTLAYAGSLGLGYYEGLRAILPTIERTGAVLNLYTRDQHCVIRHPSIINRGAHRAEELWPVVQSECDVLLQPYAFDGPMVRVYRTHFPTKISEYCWAGMPILVSGPSDATGVRWAMRHPEAARAATSLDAEGLGAVIERLKADHALRVSMAEGARAAAQEEFDPIAIRRRFADLLRTAARPRASRIAQ